MATLTCCVFAAVAGTAAIDARTNASAGAPPSPVAHSTGPGSIGLRLVDAPVSAGNDPRARVYIVDRLAPGAVIHRRIEVANTTTSIAHVALYAAAATITHGSFLGAAGHTPNELSTWTSVSPSSTDVPAGGHATATVKISVPRDAAPGERYGVVWAEVRSAPAASGVVQVSRVGIRLYLSIGSGGAPPANFTIASLTAERSPDGQPVVVAAIRNTGGRALDMSGVLQLSAGPGGLSAGPFPATLGTTLAIGDAEPVTIALDRQLPAGPWNARLTLHSGLLQHSGQAVINFPATGAAPAVTAATTGSGWLNRVVAALIVLLALTSVALFVARNQRRRRPRPRHRASRPVTTNA